MFSNNYLDEEQPIKIIITFYNNPHTVCAMLDEIWFLDNPTISILFWAAWKCSIKWRCLFTEDMTITSLIGSIGGLVTWAAWSIQTWVGCAVTDRVTYQGHDDCLSDRIDWRVGNLGKVLLEVFKLKTSGACFFNAPTRLNPVTNTPIPDRPAMLLCFRPGCKISW